MAETEEHLDITYVMHPCALDAAVKAEPGMRVAVGALPVRDAFALADRAAARERLGVGPGRFVVLVCAGSLGLGRVGRAVTAVLAASAGRRREDDLARLAARAGR